MNQTSHHKKQPDPGRSGRLGRRPRMRAARQAGTLAAVVTGRAGCRFICFASPGPDLLPVPYESAPERRYYG